MTRDQFQERLKALVEQAVDSLLSLADIEADLNEQVKLVVDARAELGAED